MPPPHAKNSSAGLKQCTSQTYYFRCQISSVSARVLFWTFTHILQKQQPVLFAISRQHIVGVDCLHLRLHPTHKHPSVDEIGRFGDCPPRSLYGSYESSMCPLATPTKRKTKMKNTGVLTKARLCLAGPPRRQTLQQHKRQDGLCRPSLSWSPREHP